MNLLKYIQAQGIGSRKTCQSLIQNNLVKINGKIVNNEQVEITPNTVQNININNEDIVVIPLPYYYILLNKPANYETSHKPRYYPSIFTLLPDHFRHTNIQAVGRLDADTTGVLLLTNDGQFNHKMTSPKYKIIKTYRVHIKHPAHETLCRILKTGVLLHDDNETVAAEQAELISNHELILTISQGKYHQVKRMIAAAGNRVTALHRLQFGNWDTQDLKTGEWRFIQPE